MHCPSLSLPGQAGQGRLRIEVADIFRAHGGAYQKTHALTAQQRKAMRAIETCRTAVLGGHLDVCPQCGDEQPSYNSCRNRHCPKCQSLQQAKWIEKRLDRLLPVPYFHVVFTVPRQLRLMAMHNRERFFNLLIEAAARTLLDLGEDPKRLGGLLAITAVLHTWTRDLQFHPHVHCVVSGGGLSPDGERWISAQCEGRYLFPRKVLSRLFSRKLLDAVTRAWRCGDLTCPGLSDPKSFARWKNELYDVAWVVYPKRPFGGPEQVFRYLGRYTHRVAISNQRLLSMDDSGVCFVTKGKKTATLPPETFIGRFLQHVLPPGFFKIRHFGLLAPANVNSKLQIARRLLQPPTPERHEVDTRALLALLVFLAAFQPNRQLPAGWTLRLLLLTGVDPRRCRNCGAFTVPEPLPRSPPPPAVLDSS